MSTAPRVLLRRGFTIVELLVVMGMFAILAGLGSITLLNSQNYANTSATIDTLITDIRQQQLKSMVGDQLINSTSVTGVHFESESYTLFQAPTYSANDPSNFVVVLPSILQFTNINLPTSQILFASASGAIIGYSDTNNSITLRNESANEQKVLIFNKYGVIVSAN